jgi:hypothetical protein
MRRKKKTNLNSDPMVETRVCTNNQQADNQESRKEKKLRLSRGRGRSQGGGRSHSQETRIKIVSYKYKRMRQKEETNLVVVVFEVKVGTRELGLDDPLEPVHWQPNVMSEESVGPVPAMRRQRTCVDDYRSRVTAPGEWTGVVVVAVDCYFH